MSIAAMRALHWRGAFFVAGPFLFSAAAMDAQNPQSGYAGIRSALRDGAR